MELTDYDREFNEALGKRLASLRKSRRMSRDSLGYVLKVSGQQISKYESGDSRMPPQRIAMCAEFFEIDIRYFYGEGEVARIAGKRNYDRAIFNFAAQISKLPLELRRPYYDLVKAMNDYIDANSEEDEKIACNGR